MMTTTSAPMNSEAIADSSMNLNQRIKEAIREAHTVCVVNGYHSAQCAVVWDIVEELQAERAHRHQAQTTALTTYCEQNPDAVECRIYDV